MYDYTPSNAAMADALLEQYELFPSWTPALILKHGKWQLIENLWHPFDHRRQTADAVISLDRAEGLKSIEELRAIMSEREQFCLDGIAGAEEQERHEAENKVTK
jgi:hypothetical protein